MTSINIDLNKIVEQWSGNPKKGIFGTHSGGDLQGLKDILEDHVKKVPKKKKLKVLMKIFHKTLLTSPYESNGKYDQFIALQGDIIKSNLVSVPFPLYDFDMEDSFFVVLPNSCIVQKISQVAVARLQPISGKPTDREKTMLLNALKMKSRRWLYIPALDYQSINVIGNVVDFHEVAVIQKSDLSNSTRVNSLTQFGWHILSNFLMDYYAKPSNDDFSIRRGSGDLIFSIDVDNI